MKSLLKLSKASEPTIPVKVGGRLHDSAIGAIYYAKRKHSQESLILKTMKLSEQNIWAITQKNKKTTLRGLKDSNVLFLSESKREAKRWQSIWCTSELSRPSTVLSKVAYIESSEQGRDGATKIMRLNEFMCESVVGVLAYMFVSPRIPHVISTKDAWIDDATGFVLQEYAGKSMYKNMSDLSLKEFQSIVLQSLVALSVCQELIHLKHHDLHLENVFINRIKDEVLYGSFTGGDLKAKERWAYTLCGSKGPVHLEFEHCGILAKIGDFGLASATDPVTKTRYERVDYCILDSGEAEWGQWSGSVAGIQSYDAIVFLSKFFLEDESELCPPEHLKWARSVYAALQTELSVECSTIGRPLRGREGNMSVADILGLSIFDEWRPTSESLKVYETKAAVQALQAPCSVSAIPNLELD